eukprot:7384010-Prymnesium_polylepis.2
MNPSGVTLQAQRRLDIVCARHCRDALAEADERLHFVAHACRFPDGLSAANSFECLVARRRRRSGVSQRGEGEPDADQSRGVDGDITTIVAARVQLVKVPRVRRPIAKLAPRPTVAWRAVAFTILRRLDTAEARRPVDV